LAEVYDALGRQSACPGAPGAPVETVQRLAAAISSLDLRRRFLEHPDLVRVLGA